MRGPGPFGCGVQCVPPHLMATRIGQGPLRLRGPPDLNLVIAGKTVRVLELFLQGRHSGRRDALVDRGEGYLIAERVV